MALRSLFASITTRQHIILVFVVSVLCDITAGAQYSISAWSPQLKEELNCTQSEIETVGEIGNMGGYLGPLSGMIVYSLPEGWVGVLIALMSVGGFLPMSLAASHRDGSMDALRNTKVLGAFFALADFATSVLYALLLQCNIDNTPPHRRGTTVAVLATIYGFSASVYSLIYNNVFHSNVGNLLLFMACALGGAGLISALLIRRVHQYRASFLPKHGLDEALMEHAYMDDGESASYHHSHEPSINSDEVIPPPMMGATLQHPGHSLSSAGMDDRTLDESSYTTPHPNTTTLLVAPSPLTAAMTAEAAPMPLPPTPSSSSTLHRYCSFLCPHDKDDSSSSLLHAQRAQHSLQRRTCGGGVCGSLAGGLLYLLRTPTYWLLITVFFLIAGTGLMAINNVGHIVQSLNGGMQDGDLTTLLIGALSVANGSGRVLMAGSDFVRWRRGVWLAGSCLLMALTHFLTATFVTHKTHLWLFVLGAGMSYGALWSIIPIIVSDLWGAENFSMNFGYVNVVAGVGGLTFNHIAGALYDSHAVENSCSGTVCYESSFLVCGAAATFAFFIALIIIPRTHRGMKNKQTTMQTTLPIDDGSEAKESF